MFGFDFLLLSVLYVVIKINKRKSIEKILNILSKFMFSQCAKSNARSHYMDEHRREKGPKKNLIPHFCKREEGLIENLQQMDPYQNVKPANVLRGSLGVKLNTLTSVSNSEVWNSEA